MNVGKIAEGADDNSIELSVDCGSRIGIRHVMGFYILAYDYTKTKKKTFLSRYRLPETVF